MNLQSLCEQGQLQLMRTEYLQAERTLVEAEAIAWDAGDWDTLSRLYMPLQEARRQIRLRCGEGVVRLDLVARSADERIDVAKIIQSTPTGQLLIAGWKSIAPAIELRRLQKERQLYLEAFLAVVYPVGRQYAVVLVPTAEIELPSGDVASLEALQQRLPGGCVVLPIDALPGGEQTGTSETFARVSALWEQLHLPFLKDADTEPSSLDRAKKYRRTIDVDYACELAHQKLSITARELARG